MKEYENKSLEELRYEDYLAGRKNPGAATTQPGGMFGASTAQTGSFFGQQQQQQQQQQKPLFGAPATSKSQVNKIKIVKEVLISCICRHWWNHGEHIRPATAATATSCFFLIWQTCRFRATDDVHSISVRIRCHSAGATDQHFWTTTNSDCETGLWCNSVDFRNAGCQPTFGWIRSSSSNHYLRFRSTATGKKRN
jgi:hypothetical protein